MQRTIKNLNTHEIRVLEKGKFTLYPKYHIRPKIVYEMKENPIAPDADILYTTDVTNLPAPSKDNLYIVNRDTITAVRKIENRMRQVKEYKDVFDLVKHSPNWRELLANKRKAAQITRVHYRLCLKFIDRTDLRAPGIQVRDKDSKVSHCLGLISEFD